MTYTPIATTWAALKATARVLVLTEPERLELARRIAADLLPLVAHVGVLDIDGCDESAIGGLTGQDLLIVLLTAEGFVKRGYSRRFSPFEKPPGLRGKYIFIRLDIPQASLLRGLHTPLERVEAAVRALGAYGPGRRVRVTAPSGTDITVQVAQQHVTPFSARQPGGLAFLPPAEVWEDLVPGSANGVIVADITVGELRFGADLIDPLGLVDSPVTITVRDGRVTDISGGDTARRLTAGLNRLDSGLQTLVELGHGLSDLAPTGIIGVDESMGGTCHFGIGAHRPYHVDVVVAEPTITVVG